MVDIDKTDIDNSDLASELMASAAQTQAPKKNETRNRVLLIIGLFVAIFAILGCLSLYLLSNNQNTPTIEVEEDDPNADYSQENTGGEEPERPDEEDIYFLAEYGLSDDDIDFIEAKLDEVLEEYYGNVGYDAVVFDLNSVVKSSSGDSIFFKLHTDVRDRDIEVTVTLVDGEVDTLEIF